MTIRLRHLLILLVVATSLVSCFKDDTTLGTGAISEILIDSASIKEVYNINQHDTLTIIPQFSQTNEEKEVTYLWEIELEPYSHNKKFVYPGKELGTFHCRLIIENEDGRAFFPFIVHVNTAYEEGLTVLSHDTNGKAMLSFMLTPPDGSKPSGFMTGDQFSLNNEEPFADNPRDMVHCSGSLIIACQGSDDGQSPATIYGINDKTFLLENMATDPEFTDFKPTILGIPGIEYSGRSYPVLCEGGHTYEYSTTEGALSKPIKLPHNYAQTSVVYTKNKGYYNVLCWDNELNALCLIYNGYAPAYYSCPEYHSNRDSIIIDPKKNIFYGLNQPQICKMVFVEQAPNLLSTPKVLVITKDIDKKSGENRYQKTLISADFWETVNGENKLVDGGGYKVCGMGDVPLTETTPCVASNTYSKMLFAEGNKIRRWNYASNTRINAAQVHKTIGSEDAIITSMSLSADQTKTYVAFYEPKQPGLNGSVWIIDTDKGTVLEEYNNVCYKPVKIIYKKK